MFFSVLCLLCRFARLFICALWSPAGTWPSLDWHQSKKESKDQELIQSSTTPDPGYQWESNNVPIRHHKREPRGQPFAQQVTTRHTQTDVHESITKQDRNNINNPQKQHRLGTVSTNILLEGLNRFNGAPTSPLVQMWINIDVWFA